MAIWSLVHAPPLRSLLILVVSVGLAVCSSDSTRPDDDRPASNLPDGLETVTCTGLSLASSSGLPLDRIGAGTVPPELEPPFAALVLDTDGTILGSAWFEVDETGRADLVTPIHPSGSIEGGEVMIRATNGTVACEPWPFSIQPLPASPGEMAAVVDGLQEILRAQAAVLGSTPEVLRTTALDDLPSVVVPLAIAQWVLDHPENDASLRALADGSRPDGISPELTNALLARTGFRDALEANVPTRTLPLAGGPSMVVEPGECTRNGIGQNTQLLSDCMGLADGLSEDVRGVLMGAADELGAAVLAESLVPGSVRAAVRDFAWVALQQSVGWHASLPTYFEDPVVEAEPAYFAEDNALPGRWSASLVAGSVGISEEQMQGVFVILFSVAALQGLERLDGSGWVTLDFDPEEEVDRLIPGPVLEHVREGDIPAEVFGPFPIDDETWSRVSYEALSDGGPSVSPVAHNTYRANAVGRTRIVVEVPGTMNDAFGGLRAEGTAVVEVDSLIIRIEPSDTIVALGDTTDFRVTVENAHTKGPLEALLLSGDFSGQLVAFDDTGETSYRLRYRAPSQPSVDSALIAVEDESTEGARANGPLRSDTARVRIAYLGITTGSECTPLGGSPIQMETQRSGWMDDSDLIWSARLGTVDGAGLYTPPTTAGVDTVTVALRDDPRFTDFVVLPVGGCTCQGSLTVDGTPAATSRLSFTLTSDLSAIGAVSLRGGPFEQTTFGFGSDPSAPGQVAIGYTGPAEGGVSGTVGEVRFLNPDDPGDPAVSPLTVSIRENTGSLLAGSFSGEVAIPTNDPDPRIASLRFDFYIAADPTLSTDQVKRCEVPVGGS